MKDHNLASKLHGLINFYKKTLYLQTSTVSMLIVSSHMSHGANYPPASVFLSVCVTNIL